jgi:hypothetical protein
VRWQLRFENTEVAEELAYLFSDNWTGQILFIGHMLHPFDILSIEHLGDSDM